MKIKLLTFLFITFCISSVQARQWQSIAIPGAYCGSGQQYKVFIDPQQSDQLLIEFMGGGACWDLWTCFGPNPRTFLFRVPALSYMSAISSSNPAYSPFTQASAIYFPYCSGDIHVGNHIQRYQLRQDVYHYGKINVLRSIDYLVENQLIDFDQVKEFTLFGASAGAMASLFHAHRFNDLMPNAQKKRIIADSAGLHFGNTFWDKFTRPMVRNIFDAAAEIQSSFRFDGTYFTANFEEVCSFYHDFDIAFLQGSRDLVMTRIFGDLSSRELHEAIHLPYGLFQATKNIPNCSAWVPSSRMHTYLLLPPNPFKDVRTEDDNLSAFDFVNKFIKGQVHRNYK